MSAIKISIDVKSGGRAGAALLLERIHDVVNNSTAYIPGKKTHLVNSNIELQADGFTYRARVEYAGVSLKDAAPTPGMTTRMDPITGLEEAWFNGVFVGVFANEADAMKHLLGLAV